VPRFAKNYPRLAKVPYRSGGIHQDLLGFAFTEGKIVTANFDFHRITHRREANQFHFGSHQQSHFHESRAAAGRNVDLRDGCAAAGGQSCERVRNRGHNINNLCRFDARAHWLNHNGIREFLTDAQSSVANLANKIRLMAQKFHDLFLAETEFPKPIPVFRCAGEFLDANDRPGLDVAERANRGSGAFAVNHHAGLRFLVFAHCGPK
jgi:hypothetical protein